MALDNKVTLLIVDDDEGHTELITRNLRRAGIANHIVTLLNGTEALDFVFCRGKHADRKGGGELLILLDIRMPGSVDGVEVLRQIKADPKTRRIPVIMLTTTDDPREINRCYDLGCNIYLRKPVESSAFSEALSRLGRMISVMKAPTNTANP